MLLVYHRCPEEFTSSPKWAQTITRCAQGYACRRVYERSLTCISNITQLKRFL